MIMNRNLPIALAFALASALPSHAQSDLAPEFINPSPGSNVVIQKMSDNGKWMVAEAGSTTDGDIRPVGGTLINLDDLTEKYTISHSSNLAGVGDVTDDGSIVVGECRMLPAYWSKASGEWTILELPQNYTTGRLTCVTPDGHYAAGFVYNGNIWEFYPVFYDLTTGKQVDLPDLPNTDMTNSDQKQNMITAISPDGRYILGTISQSYIQPVATCTYVYDRQNATHEFIGFTEPASSGGKWKADVDGLLFVDTSNMSPNGQWVGGMAYMSKAISGSEFGREYYVSYRYNIAEDNFEIYDGTYDSDIGGFSITNDGVLLSAQPAVNPYSSMMVRYGSYFYSLDQILKQVYNIDFEAKTGYSVTGKPVQVSSDGLTIGLLPSTDETYILRLKEPLTNACANIDLLGDYTITPAEGSVFSALRTISINFGRTISVVGDPATVTIVNSNGGVERDKALTAVAEASTLTIGFRTLNMAAGETYTVKIPAGMVSLAGDSNMKSREITITYTGRAAGPVNLVSAYPADGSEFSRLDMTTNPIVLTFDAQIAAAENAIGYFYRTDEDQILVCELNVACQNNQMLAYPTAGQYLYSGIPYRVVFPEGTVTDISGSGACQEIELNYTGTYVREVPSGTRYIFNENCSSYENFMFYEGDHLTPASGMARWGFDADNSPWIVVRDNSESTDMAFGSHSMYTPAGQADDWVTTNQLFIPDDNCVLMFDSQSYLNSKQDYLKVYVLESDDILQLLNESAVERFRTEGELIYNELQSPGSSEENLDGDWRHNVVSLEKYSGKSIYIAFVNDNNDQSAVFIDNIVVLRDVPFITTFENPTRVVDQESVTIRGALSITSEIDTYNAVTMILKDADGNTIDTIEETGLSLKNQDVFQFRFANPLPLVKGEDNSFTVTLTLNNDSENETEVSSSVKNLTFQPVQKVVLEEYTGSSCGNCPLGIVAIENLENLYGNRFIPLTLRCYGGDMLGTGVGTYASFLGLQAAPTGRINRGDISSPMISVDTDYRFSGEGITMSDGSDSRTWLDFVQAEFEKQADAQISISPTYNEADMSFSLACTVKSALNLKSQNICLFTVVSENNLITYQDNYLASTEDTDLGEWGKGGKYAQSTVYPYTAMDVVRGTYGTTFNGTGGLIPSTLECDKEYTATISGSLPSTVADADNCEVTVMMIDANTNLIINADQVSLTGKSGIESVAADSKLESTIVAIPSALQVTAAGKISVEAYSISGSLIAEGEGEDFVELSTAGYSGPAIVRVTSATNSAVVKTVLK